MANPMQKKSRRSFLLGILVAVIIMGIVVAILLMQIMRMQQAEEERVASQIKVYALNMNVKSGQIITPDMLSQIETSRDAVPTNAVQDVTDYYLVDQDGNQIVTVVTDEETKETATAVIINGEEHILNNIEGNTATYTIQNEQTRTEETRTITMEGTPVMAKIDMQEKTVLTSNSIAQADDLVSDSTRLQEYNMIMLSTGLTTDDYIDIRLRMPSGLDYVVVSKKKIEVPIVDGVESASTIWVNLTEEETLMMSNAIVEAYMMEGAILYTTKYIEPGMQVASTPTYIPSEAVINLVQSDPNIVEEAKTAMISRFNSYAEQTRNSINGEISQTEEEDRETNLNTGVSTEVTTAQEQRQTYLEALAGGE